MPNPSRVAVGSTLARVAMLLVVIATVLGWIAIGHMVEAGKADHRAAGVALQQGITIAQSADSVADQLQTTVDALGRNLADQPELADAAREIAATQPALLTAIGALEAVPDELRTAQVDLAASDDDHSAQLGLWRVALLLAAISALLALTAIDRLATSRR